MEERRFFIGLCILCLGILNVIYTFVTVTYKSWWLLYSNIFEQSEI